VRLQDGTSLPAKLTGIDEKTDLAVIKVETDRPLAFVSWADSAKARVGDKVLAVGNPFGLGGTVTGGIVSATGRELGAGPYDDFLQVDAAINRGNSGGPTFSLDGQVVGVNSIIFSPSGGNVGIGFAISANLAKEVAADLIQDGRVERGWLGVRIQEMDQDIAQALGGTGVKGALVTSVEPGSPADKAGIKTGDVIRRFGSHEIDRLRQLTRAVAEAKPGTAADAVIWSKAGERTVKVEVGKQAGAEQVAGAATTAEPAQPRLGLQLANLTPELRERLGLGADAKGVVVQGVAPGSPAEEKGIQAGDLILRVGEHQVARADEVVKLVKQAHEHSTKSVLLLVQRDRAQLFTAIPIAVS